MLCGTLLGAQNAAPDWVAVPELLDDSLETLSPLGEVTMIAADLDNDGDDDVIVARKEAAGFMGAFSNLLLINDDCQLVDMTDIYTNFANPTAGPSPTCDAQVLDANGDGWLDVLFVNTGFHQLRLYGNRGENGGAWLGLEEVVLADGLELYDYSGPQTAANFQFWYRDQAGGGANFNLSDGLSVCFAP